MHIDLMVGPSRWDDAAELARATEEAGFSGMLFTETGQTPWMSMVAASIAWELADNTGGRFRLGLGSQVKAHIERRYGMEFDPPGPRMRDYLLAVQNALAAFRGDAKLDHDGPYYSMSLLPAQWRPLPHEHGDIKVDVSAVGPWMTKMAGAVADGVHVHPLHSRHYIDSRLIPSVQAGAEEAGRAMDDVDLLIPAFIVPGDTPDERAFLAERAKTQIGFYGSTRNYAFQFDDLGFDGTSARLNERLKAGDIPGMNELITDEMLDTFAIVGPWDEIPDRLVERYGPVAERVISYLTTDDIANQPDNLGKWAEVAAAVRAA